MKAQLRSALLLAFLLAFSVASVADTCTTDTIPATFEGWTTSNYKLGNMYICNTNTVLTSFEDYLDPTAPTELNFFVYEGTQYSGTYNRVFEWVVRNCGTEPGFYSSGQTAVNLVAGRYYIIGVGHLGEVANTYQHGVYPNTAFGRLMIGYSTWGYPPGPTTSNYFDTFAFYQKVTACQVGRATAIGSPRGGEWYEPGTTVQIKWATAGPGWTSGDTVKLEYSSDSGSTWNAISGAESLAYDSGSFNWNTTGVTPAATYRVRAAFNGDPSVTGCSVTDFSLSFDSTPPTIIHTPAQDTPLLGPFIITATVTDNLGVGSATLYWSKNGGNVQQTPMYVSGVNQYRADIPRTDAYKDRFCYYIEARDSSITGNVSRSPSGAPSTLNCFTITGCTSNTLGSTAVGGTGSGRSRGNTYCWGSVDRTLSRIEHYMNIPSSTELRFFVYESTSQTGTYSKIMEKVVANSGTGVGWYSSGPIDVHLAAGRYYIIGASAQGSAMHYWAASGHPVTVDYGQSLSGYASAVYPTPATTSYPTLTTVTNQRLTFCVVRRLNLTAPLGGQVWEPGVSVMVCWNYNCSEEAWSATDTVRVEYSTDSGSTWNPIAGAESIPYALCRYVWDSTGVPASTHYRVRVISNQDPLVSGMSPVDFTFRWDTTPPSITHTPLPDTYNNLGPYNVNASVSDISGVASKAVYWSKNGGPFTCSGGMSIPGPSNVGDRYCYYIEATDSSTAANTSRLPADAPASYFCFSIVPCMTDTVSVPQYNTDQKGRMHGNEFKCTIDAALTSIEHYLNIQSATELKFYVYEGSPLTKIYEKTITSSGTGAGWYSSGPIVVPLVSGRWYSIGTAWKGKATGYWNDTGHPVYCAFGLSTCGNGADIYPPPDTAPYNTNHTCYYQRLSTCRLVRAIGALYPNGGEMLEQGHITIRWSAAGAYWLSTDTVRLEYSSDGGSNWHQIAGAESLLYNATSFDWDASAMEASDHYRIRVVFSDDSSVADGSDGDFTIRTDLIPPVITHTAMYDTGDMTGPYRVCANITDAYGLQAVTLRWSKNDSPFTALAMTKTADSDQYCASIPGTSVLGDRYCYYIEARDASAAGNVTVDPPGAPSRLDCFMAIQATVDALGAAGNSDTRTGGGMGNIFLCNKPHMALTGIKQRLYVPDPTEVTFFVYESPTLNGTYTKLHENTVWDPTTSWIWPDSGAISVPLTQGKYYLIGLASKGSANFIWTHSSGTGLNNFGQRAGWAEVIGYPPPATVTNSNTTDNMYIQKITSNAYVDTIPAGKKSADGYAVRLEGSKVSATFDGRFYAECPNRSSGIGVLWARDMPAVGDLVTVIGGMTIRNGERVMGACRMSATDHGDPPSPFAMSNLRVGGADFFCTDGPPPTGQKGIEEAADLNNIGLLVTTYGRVTVAGSDFFYIDDGSHVEDHSIFIGLRVLCPGLSKPALGEYVAVTGISSPLKVGEGLFRSIRVRGEGDIRVIASN